MSLKNKAVNGVRWTLLTAVVNASLHIIQLMVMARYLSSHDFGLIAILMVVINFGQLFVDFGLSQSIIYKNKVTNTQLSTLYWMNIILSLIVIIIIVLSSSFISNFYNEANLDYYIVLTSSVLILQAIGQQFRVLFQKELNFDILAKIDIFSVIISFISAMLFVMNGFGIYSLIFPIIISAFLKSLLLVHYGIKYHKPKLILQLSDIKDFLKFGSYTLGDNIVNTISAEMDVIIIGKLLGTEALGVYSVIKELILRPAQIINPIITKVAFPTLSSINHDLDQIKLIYLKLINYVSSINFPIYIASLVLGYEIVQLFLGVKWLDYVELFQILAIWALIRSIGNPVGTLLMATGKPQYGMYWNSFMMIYMPIVIYIGSFWGLNGIACANVLSMFVLFVPGWYYLIYKLINVKLKEYINSFIIPLNISIIIGILVYFLLNIFNERGLLYILSIIIFIAFPLLWFFNKKYNSKFYNIILNLFGK